MRVVLICITSFDVGGGNEGPDCAHISDNRSLIKVQNNDWSLAVRIK